MAIYLVDNFKLGVKRLIDERTNISTLEELENLATTFIPYGLIVHCDEDDNLYKFGKEIDENGIEVEKWTQLTMSVERLFFEYNTETELYDIPIFVHNAKVIEHPIEEINDWIGLKDGEHKFDILSKFIDNDVIVSEKTWNALKFSTYKKEMYDKYKTFIENNITMVAKPNYTKVDSEEEMIETGRFYIMDPDGSGSYTIYVVTEDGETLSISSTNIDMSDYQPKNAPELKTENKFVLEAINEVNTKFQEQRALIGSDKLVSGVDEAESTLSQYISDIYNKYIKFMGSTGNLKTIAKDTLVNAINEIVEKLGNLEDMDDLIEKSSFVNSINNLYDMSQIRTGTVISYAGSSAPAGYLMCDGSAVNPNDYPGLYDVIGTRFGVTSDGKFMLPNLKGKVVIGEATSGSNIYNFGASIGAKTHTLSNSHMPSHTHSIASEKHTHSSVTSHNATKTGTPPGGSRGDDGGDGKCATSTYTDSGSHNHGDAWSDSSSHTHTCSYNVPGGGYSHNNLMPYVVLNYIIKY